MLEVAPGQPYVTLSRVTAIWYVWLAQLESVPDVISTSTVVTLNRERGTRPTVALHHAPGSDLLPVALSAPVIHLPAVPSVMYSFMTSLMVSYVVTFVVALYVALTQDHRVSLYPKLRNRNVLPASIASAVTVKSIASCRTTASYPRYTPRANALVSVRELSCASATAPSCVNAYVSSSSVDAGGRGVSASLGKSLMRVVLSSAGCCAQPSEARHASVHSASAAMGRDARVSLLFVRARRERARSPRARSVISRAPASTPARATSEKR